MTTSAGPLLHNVRVASRVATAAGDTLPAEGAALYGMAIGMALALRSPNTARALRQEIERISAGLDHRSPEEAEIDFRRAVDLFDRRAG